MYAEDGTMTLAGLDLNLVVALEAMLVEGSVTRAARRVGLSQPAMSNALARLRALLDDPLFVRRGRQMVPTPRCQAMHQPIREAMALLRSAVQPPAMFDPQAPTRYRIAMTDYVGWVLLPKLLAWLREHAPNAIVEVLPADGFAVPAEALHSARIDLAINRFVRIPRGIDHAPLFSESFVCLARADHPRIGKRLTLRQYTRTPHLLVSGRGRVPGLVDRMLATRGLKRTVAATVPHFVVAPNVVAETDLIATIAERVARGIPTRPAVTVHRAPLPLEPFAVEMAWDPRSADDPRHQWLCAAVRRVAAGL